MEESKQSSHEAKYVTTNPKKSLYARASKWAPEAIRVLAKAMRSPTESIRVKAAVSLLAKCLPDVSAVAVKGDATAQIPVYKWLLYGKNDPILERLEQAPQRGISVLQGDMVEVAPSVGIVTNNPDNNPDNRNTNGES